MSTELQALKDQVNLKRSSMNEQINHLESLREEVKIDFYFVEFTLQFTNKCRPKGLERFLLKFFLKINRPSGSESEFLYLLVFFQSLMFFFYNDEAQILSSTNNIHM